MKYTPITVVALLLYVACGDEAASTRDAATMDAGWDSHLDSPLDSSLDASTDVGGDAADAPRDADPADGGHDAASPRPVDLRFNGVFPIKALVQGKIFALMLDRPLGLRTELGWPSRSIRWINTDGEVIRSRGSSGMRYLLDAALHPSGQFTLLFATKTGYSLERTDDTGQVLGVWDVQDTLIDSDLPPAPPPGGPIPSATYDTGRIAAQGEVVVLATRTGRNSVIAYRVDHTGGDAFSILSRAVVVPPFSMPGIGLTGGSYDTFGLVNAQYAVHLSVGPDGLIYVGVRYPELAAAQMLKAHKTVFGETLMGDPDALDSYVTRLSAAGVRTGTSVISTAGPDELQSLHAVARGVYVTSRTEQWNAQGTGFDVIVSYVDASTGGVNTRQLDVNAGDIGFDVLPLRDGDLLVVGASGYTQNPNGASVSESSQSFARRWSAAGASTAIPLPQGPRHNEARFVVPYGQGQLLIGGMLDGPGTHSADSDPTLLRADGYVVSVAVAP